MDQVIRIGRNALYFEDYVVSIGYFNQVIALRDWMAEPYFYRSVAKVSLEDYLGAKEDALAAIDRNPLLPKAYLVLGVSSYHLGQPEEAIKAYREGLERSPSDVGLRYNYAIALLEDKRYDEVIREADSLEYFSRGNKDALILKAEALLAKKDTLSASKITDELLARDSNYIGGYLFQAQIAIERKDYLKGIKLLDKVISLKPDQPNYYANRAILHYHRNELEASMRDYTEALRLDPRNEIARTNRALLRADVGEVNGAIKDWTELIKMKPQDVIARYNRALLLSERHRYKEALEDVSRVIASYPSFIDAYYVRSEIYKKLGNQKLSEKDYWQAYRLQTEKKLRDKTVSQSLSNKTRKASDTAIEKYKQLIEAMPEDQLKEVKYSEKSRGRVQDRAEQAIPMPFATLRLITPSEDDKSYHLEEADRLARRYGSPYRLGVATAFHALSSQELEQIRTFISRLEAEPESRERNLLLAICYLQLQNIEKAAQLMPKGAQGESLLASLLEASIRYRELKNKALLASEENESDKEKAARSKVLERSLPLQGEPLLSYLNEAIRLAPKSAIVYYNRALSLAEVGSLSAALKDYDEALRLDPSLAEAYYNSALLLLAEGKREEAIKRLSRAGELGLYQAYSIIKQHNKKDDLGK